MGLIMEGRFRMKVRTSEEILNRMRAGIDCTEDESAVVMRAIRFHEGEPLAEALAEVFTAEAAQVNEETPETRAAFAAERREGGK